MRFTLSIYLVVIEMDISHIPWGSNNTPERVSLFCQAKESTVMLEAVVVFMSSFLWRLFQSSVSLEASTNLESFLPAGTWFPVASSASPCPVLVPLRLLFRPPLLVGSSFHEKVLLLHGNSFYYTTTSLYLSSSLSSLPIFDFYTLSCFGFCHVLLIWAVLFFGLRDSLRHTSVHCNHNNICQEHLSFFAFDVLPIFFRLIQL